MSDATMLLGQVRFEQRSFWRNPASAVFVFLFPIIFLVVFATLFKGSTTKVGALSVAYDDYYIPALTAFGVIGSCFTNIAMSLSIRRDSGILKRLRGTPLPSRHDAGGDVVGRVMAGGNLLALSQDARALRHVVIVDFRRRRHRRIGEAQIRRLEFV